MHNAVIEIQKHLQFSNTNGENEMNAVRSSRYMSLTMYFIIVVYEFALYVSYNVCYHRCVGLRVICQLQCMLSQVCRTSRYMSAAMLSQVCRSSRYMSAAMLSQVCMSSRFMSAAMLSQVCMSLRYMAAVMLSQVCILMNQHMSTTHYPSLLISCRRLRFSPSFQFERQIYKCLHFSMSDLPCCQVFVPMYINIYIETSHFACVAVIRTVVNTTRK